ncbi:dual specificity protein phosphatase family protein [Pelagibacteraceae bacterium]|nr:dual specificity protein phosphatase family protein [Pelagibacteraceae bacterium]
MIIVCSLKDVPEVCESVKPKYLVSVIDPGYAPETPKSVQKHLKLGFDDILKISPDNHIFRLNTDEIPQLPPNESHINSIKKFTESWDVEENIVIHCWCGVSRSMATATYLMCKNNTVNIENNIKYIRSIAPHANPNKLLIKLFEDILGTKGQIAKSYEKYPHTKTYDCSSNFAPITLFNYKEMLKFK